MARIVIVGCGFGALTAVRALRRRQPDAELVLVAPRPELVYYASLVWVPTGLRRGATLAVDVTRFLARQRVEYRATRAIGLADGGRSLLTEQGPVANDGLIIASGPRFLKKIPGIEHSLSPCAGIAAAEMIRGRLAAMGGGRIAVGFGANPAEPTAVRGGPMFELLFGIDTWLRRQHRRERFTLTFFNASNQPGQRLGERAVARLLAEMRRRGIVTHLGHKILGFEADRVRTEGGDVAADLILFMPGLTGSDWLADSGLPLSAGGFVQADAHCRVPGHERVYVVGDAGSYPGPDWLPKQGHQADLQAQAAAANLVAELRGEPARTPFKAELVCIVDTLDGGVLVQRTPARMRVHASPLWHWAKRYYEWQYLRAYR
jgi:sulfide:quinone oxidoreductase